jgi:hypothetical protein
MVGKFMPKIKCPLIFQTPFHKREPLTLSKMYQLIHFRIVLNGNEINQFEKLAKPWFYFLRSNDTFEYEAKKNPFGTFSDSSDFGFNKPK